MLKSNSINTLYVWAYRGYRCPSLAILTQRTLSSNPCPGDTVVENLKAINIILFKLVCNAGWHRTSIQQNIKMVMLFQM